MGRQALAHLVGLVLNHAAEQGKRCHFCFFVEIDFLLAFELRRLEAAAFFGRDFVDEPVADFGCEAFELLRRDVEFEFDGDVVFVVCVADNCLLTTRSSSGIQRRPSPNLTRARFLRGCISLTMPKRYWERSMKRTSSPTATLSSVAIALLLRRTPN